MAQQPTGKSGYHFGLTYRQKVWHLEVDEIRGGLTLYNKNFPFEKEVLEDAVDTSVKILIGLAELKLEADSDAVLK